MTDVVSPNLAATVSDCENISGPVASFPTTLAVGDSLICQYERALPDATTRTDTVKAAQQNYKYSPAEVATPIGTWTYRNTATATFGAIPTYEIDECITGEDILSQLGAQVVAPTDFGPWCVGSAIPHTFEIMHTFGGTEGIPLECENNHFDNVGEITANDTGATDSDPATIDIFVECAEGCTLTLGYWKAHNESFRAGANGKGPPPDTTWFAAGADFDGDTFIEGENETFFLSGQTWFQVFMTAPQGNVYYNLAHQYMAAKLNVLAGASAAALGTALSDAEALFAAYTPAQIGALKGKPSDAALRDRFITLAGTLGQYNEGLIGPGHCTENGS